MLATMQLRLGAAERALAALGPVVGRSSSGTETTEILLNWLSAAPLIEAHAVRRGMPIQRVGVSQATGRIAAEMVELYPPGIPVIAPGWPIDGASLDALEQARAAGGRVVASDPSLATVAVVADARAA
jgi:lysine decarboxylase